MLYPGNIVTDKEKYSLGSAQAGLRKARGLVLMRDRDVFPGTSNTAIHLWYCWPVKVES
jgi:hypothetical protein